LQLKLKLKNREKKIDDAQSALLADVSKGGKNSKKLKLKTNPK